MQRLAAHPLLLENQRAQLVFEEIAPEAIVGVVQDGRIGQRQQEHPSRRAQGEGNAFGFRAAHPAERRPVTGPGPESQRQVDEGSQQKTAAQDEQEQRGLEGQAWRQDRP